MTDAMNVGLLRALTSHSQPRIPPTFSSYTCAVSVYFEHVHTAQDLIGKMRRHMSVLATLSNKVELVRALDDIMHKFLFISSSNQKVQLVAMDAIRLIKLCRKSLQPARIADIWPHIQKLRLIPARDDRTSAALIGSVVSSVLEAKDTATAASVWEFMRSSPRLPLDDTHIIQLLSALHNRPDLVVELVTDLLQGSLSVRAHVKHFSVALKALAKAPKEANMVFELASTRNLVRSFFAFCTCRSNVTSASCTA